MITFATLINQKLVVPSTSGRYYAVDVHYFTEHHKASVTSIMFDQDWYLSRYPDVADALAERTIVSAHAHYTTRGYYEHRMPYEISVDEPWYLDAYADVKASVLEQHFVSGQDHFGRAGFAEGRLPFPNFKLKTGVVPS